MPHVGAQAEELDLVDFSLKLFVIRFLVLFRHVRVITVSFITFFLLVFFLCTPLAARIVTFRIRYAFLFSYLPRSKDEDAFVAK